MVAVLLVLLLLASTARATSQVDQVIAALENGRSQEALERLAPLIRVSPENPQLLALRALALRASGRQSEALQSFRAALKTAPDYLPALQGAAELEYGVGDAQALSRLKRIIKLVPDNVTAHAMLGVLQFEAGRYAEAVEHFTAAKPALTGNVPARWMYAQALYQLRRYGDASSVFAELAAAAPNHEEIRLNLALCRFAEGRYADVIASLKPQLEKARPSLPAMRLAASSHEMLKQTAEATALLRRAAELYPRDEAVYIDLAHLCLDHSAYDLGIEIIETALRNIGPTARLHTMRGILHVQAGKSELAESDFEAARQLSPDAGYGDVGLSITMMASDRLDESIALLRRRLALNPKDVTGQFVLAQALMKKGGDWSTPEYQEAHAVLQRLVQQAPDHAPAHALLGKILLTRGDPKGSIAVLERALTLAPRDRAATYQLMQAYGRVGDAAKMAKMQQRIREFLDLERREEVERNRVRLVKAPDRKRSTLP